MATLDIVVLILLLVSVIIGASRGLVYELFSLSGWLAAFFIARLLTPDVEPLVRGFLMNLPDPIVSMLAFIATFTVLVFAWGLLGNLARKLIDASGLRPVDRVMGGLFGMLRASVLVAVAGLVVMSTSLQEGAWWTQSHTARWTQAILPHALPMLQDMPDAAAHVPSLIQQGVLDMVPALTQRDSHLTPIPAKP